MIHKCSKNKIIVEIPIFYNSLFIKFYWYRKDGGLDMATRTENYAKTISKLYERCAQGYYQNELDMIIDCGKGKFVIEVKVPNDSMYCLEDGK